MPQPELAPGLRQAVGSEVGRAELCRTSFKTQPHPGWESGSRELGPVILSESRLDAPPMPCAHGTPQRSRLSHAGSAAPSEAMGGLRHRPPQQVWLTGFSPSWGVLGPSFPIEESTSRTGGTVEPQGQSQLEGGVVGVQGC